MSKINTNGFREGVQVALFKLENLDDKIKLLETYQSIIHNDLWYYRSLKPKPKLPEIPESLKYKQKYLDQINKSQIDDVTKSKFIDLLKVTQFKRDDENILSVNGSSERYINLRIDQHAYEISYFCRTDQDNFQLKLDSKEQSMYRLQIILIDHTDIDYSLPVW